MKTIIFFLIVFVGSGIILTNDKEENKHKQQEVVLQDIKPVASQIYIINADMEIIRSLDEQDVIANKLTVSEIQMLQSSDFLLSTMGGTYYLTDE